MAGCDLYVEAFAGGAACALQLLEGPKCYPPCSYMGGKRRDAPAILGHLGLRPGDGAGRVVLNDLGPWGWVWQALLDPVVSARVSEVLRSWRGEPIQDLWFRLRDEGPREDPAEAAAQWLVLQSRSASGAPVFWAEDTHPAEAGTLLRGEREPIIPERCTEMRRAKVAVAGQGAMTLLQGDRRPGRYSPAWQNKVPVHLLQGSGPGRRPQPAGQRDPGMPDPKLMASDGRGVIRKAGIKGDKPRLRRGHDAGGNRPADQKGESCGGAGGLVRIETLAERVEALAQLASRWLVLRACNAKGKVVVPPTTSRCVMVVHGRAEDLPRLLPRDMRGARVYLDPPYRGCTGYGFDVERGALVAMAELYARRGAWVAISEAEGLRRDLGLFWREYDLTRPGGKREMLTVWRP